MEVEALKTVNEAAELFRCRPETIRRYIASGQLPAKRFPNGIMRIRATDLEAFLMPVLVK